MWQEAIALMDGNYERSSRRWENQMPKTLHENLADRLSESVERLHKQVEAVEFWASAVTGFAAPVPEYEPEATKVARYLKPGRRARKRRRRRAANQNEKPDALDPHRHENVERAR
jgi:hypothetical protein